MSSALFNRLIQIANDLENKQVKVGFFETSVYDNGLPVAVIAAQNEYGGTINIPAHTVTIYRKVNADGSFAKNGKFVKRSKSNFATDHTVPAHSVTIPARPFMRPTVADKKGEWVGIVNGLIRQGMQSGVMPDVLDSVGLAMAGDIKQAIADVKTPPLSAGTLAARRARGNGSNKPLNDTGYLYAAVDHVVGGRD